MTNLQQTKTYLLETGGPPSATTEQPPPPPTSPTKHPKPSLDANQSKTYLTNSDKSVFNLKWQVGGKREKYHPRSQSKEKKSPEPPRHRQHRYTTQRPLHIITSRRSPVPPTSVKRVPKRVVVAPPSPPTPPPSYPYALPPMSDAVRSRIESGDGSGTRLIARVKHSDGTLNLLQGTKQLKIEHHYVDSETEAEKVIKELRRKGYVETGIATTGTQSDDDQD